jgi:hypothetical protein
MCYSLLPFLCRSLFCLKLKYSNLYVEQEIEFNYWCTYILKKCMIFLHFAAKVWHKANYKFGVFYHLLKHDIYMAYLDCLFIFSFDLVFC